MLLGGTIPLSQLIAQTQTPILGGWIGLKSATRRFIKTNEKPYFYQHQAEIKGTGQDKQVLLWKHLEAAMKAEFDPHFQEIGDCTGQAVGLGIDTLTAVQIGLHKKNERWMGKCSTEAVYAGGRIEIGEGIFCFHKRRPSDGCCNTYLGEYARDYGVLLRGKYGKIDISKYNPRLAKIWGSYGVGVPDDLEVISKPHPVQTISLVGGWDEACDLIANGHVIAIGSSIGFETETDNDGFLVQNKEGWNHSMLLWGIDSKSKREGGCLANSWGTNWVVNRRTHKLGTPSGCFWADAKVIDKMLRHEDSIALSQYIGYPRQQLDYRLW